MRLSDSLPCGARVQAEKAFGGEGLFAKRATHKKTCPACQEIAAEDEKRLAKRLLENARLNPGYGRSFSDPEIDVCGRPIL